MSQRPSKAIRRAWSRLGRTHALVRDAMEAELKAAGLPPLGWSDALSELRRAEPTGLRPAELEARLLLTQSTVSRLLERLVAAGLAKRQAVPGDGRGQVIVITREGRALLKRTEPVHGRALQSCFGGKLGDVAAAAIADALAPILDEGDEDEP